MSELLDVSYLQMSEQGFFFFFLLFISSKHVHITTFQCEKVKPLQIGPVNNWYIFRRKYQFRRTLTNFTIKI